MLTLPRYATRGPVESARRLDLSRTHRGFVPWPTGQVTCACALPHAWDGQALGSRNFRGGRPPEPVNKTSSREYLEFMAEAGIETVTTSMRWVSPCTSSSSGCSSCRRHACSRKCVDSKSRRGCSSSDALSACDRRRPAGRRPMETPRQENGALRAPHRSPPAFHAHRLKPGCQTACRRRQAVRPRRWENLPAFPLSRGCPSCFGPLGCHKGVQTGAPHRRGGC